MSTTYTETPDNYGEIETEVVSQAQEVKSIFYHAEKVLFYDTCSFQYHSNLPSKEQGILIEFFKEQKTAVFLTRTVIMELAGERHRLTKKITDFIKAIHSADIKVVVYNEENTYDILAECFSTTERINKYLMWAVRTVKTPVSTITDTIKTDERLYSEVIAGNDLKSADLYRRFCCSVRNNKEHEDNLGEELIAICVNILSSLPGMPDGKICVLTDDKGAASKISSLMLKNYSRNLGSRIMLYSTPKLVQHMYQEHGELTEDEMVRIISKGSSGNVVVMGLMQFDLDVNAISLSCRDLVKKIMEPNGITIVF